MATINGIEIGNVEMFIIPNEITKISALHPFMAKDIFRQFDQMGFQYQDGDYAVQVWIHSEGHENWACHGAPSVVIKELRKINGIEGPSRGMIPAFVPASILRKAREGWPVDLGHLKGVVARQLPYRHGEFGTFEEVFTSLVYR